MALLAKYHVPGLYVEDRSIPVPLDWRGKTPGQWVCGSQEGVDKSGRTLQLFYRVVCAPEHVHDDLPLLVFFQGGPGGAGPRPISPSSDGWIEEAVRHFRVILPDQRGTGRSSRVDSHVMVRFGSAQDQEAYLKRFLADSIVRDFEHLRLTQFAGARWVTLGQSYGGFLTLAYLSLFAQGVVASFTTGGIPHVPADAQELYEHTFPRMERKSLQYYERYPQDVERVGMVARMLADDVRPVKLANGDRLTVERLQTLGATFGMKPSFEWVHWVFDSAFVDGDGSASVRSALSDQFLESVESYSSSNPLYWPLQEAIYADGGDEGELARPLDWAAQRVRDGLPQFGTDRCPLLFTGEAVFPWMFEQESQLRPYRQAVELLMQDVRFPKIYDAAQLARNEVPLQAAVYFDDMYVPSELQLDTLSRIGNSHAWVTNEFEHDGVHGPQVFARLFKQALDRGDLEELF